MMSHLGFRVEELIFFFIRINFRSVEQKCTLQYPGDFSTTFDCFLNCGVTFSVNGFDRVFFRVPKQGTNYACT